MKRQEPHVGRPARAARSLLRLLHARRLEDLSEEELATRTVVFAPHPDDETLGCGAAILRKRQLGAEVWIVFLSDGSASHSSMMEPGQLAVTREQEARSAAELLGVPGTHLVFLRLPDGHLEEHEGGARSRVAEIVAACRPDDVYVPYRHDHVADHVATYRVVTAALADGDRATTVYEYPIWFWECWPWMVHPITPLTTRRFALRSALSAGRLLGDFRHRVALDGCSANKLAALAAHRSQMERLVLDENWPVLAEVGGGDFLRCFFSDQEIFARSGWPPDSVMSR